MSDKTISNDITIANFHKLIDSIPSDSQSTKTLKILGGEPTLHPNISKIIAIGLIKFNQIQIFTNGIFSYKLRQLFLTYTPRLSFTFNIMTPGFLFNMKIKKLVTGNIMNLTKKTEVTLSLTIDPYTGSIGLMRLIPKDILDHIKNYRIGLSNPIAGQKNYYAFSDFPKIGDNLISLVNSINKINSKAKFLLNCGFTRCMFTTSQLKYLKTIGVTFNGWGCFGKSSSMDINPNQTAFHCFPLSTVNRKKITSSPVLTNTALINDRYKFWHRIETLICRKCPFYGHTPNKCPGPCIAFRMNNLTVSN